LFSSDEHKSEIQRIKGIIKDRQKQLDSSEKQFLQNELQKIKLQKLKQIINLDKIIQFLSSVKSDQPKSNSIITKLKSLSPSPLSSLSPSPSVLSSASPSIPSSASPSAPLSHSPPPPTIPLKIWRLIPQSRKQQISNLLNEFQTAYLKEFDDPKYNTLQDLAHFLYSKKPTEVDYTPLVIQYSKKYPQTKLQIKKFLKGDEISFGSVQHDYNTEYDNLDFADKLLLFWKIVVLAKDAYAHRGKLIEKQQKLQLSTSTGQIKLRKQSAKLAQIAKEKSGTTFTTAIDNEIETLDKIFRYIYTDLFLPGNKTKKQQQNKQSKTIVASAA
jgi:hypothetical protein